MSIFIGFLYVVEVVVCLLLVLVVMLQKPKEGGLGGAISGGMLEASLGADAGNVLIRTTVVLVMSWGMVFITNTQGGIVDISKRSWLFLILSGLATGASWL